MKGIILAGGSGSRLYPITTAVSKQLLPVYDKPTVYFPLSVLLLSGIREILVITKPGDQAAFRQLLGDGAHFGARLHYATQPRPEGIAQAFLIGAEFGKGDPVALALGDNIFYGETLRTSLQAAARQDRGATVFAYRVKDPERYGIIHFDPDGRAVGIEEKPSRPRSSYAVTGLYFYDARVYEIAETLKPSDRGELEITDVNRQYLEWGELRVQTLGRGVAWLDTGTPHSLLEASTFIQTVQERQGLQVACLEEIAYREGYLSRTALLERAESLRGTEYGRYLHLLATQPEPHS